MDNRGLNPDNLHQGKNAGVTHLLLGARGVAESTLVFVEAVQLHWLLGQNLTVVLVQTTEPTFKNMYIGISIIVLVTIIAKVEKNENEIT